MHALSDGAVPFPLFMSGWVLPEEGPLPKGSATGSARRVEGVPLLRVAFPAERSVAAGAIALVTAAASYACTKPATTYKKAFAAAEATAAHSREVLRALAGDSAGEGATPNIEFKEVRRRNACILPCMLRRCADAQPCFALLPLRRCAPAWRA